MEVIETVAEMQAIARRLRAEGRQIGFVPTMGALHAGHLSLIESARAAKAEVIVVSIFVNPTQFGPSEDFSKYPRPKDTDLAACASLGVDYVFHPSAAEMYPTGYSVWVNEEKLSQGLCGKSRPSHFRGVTTVVAKLFHIVQPHVAVFGQKDGQQLAIIRRMVRDLNMDIEIVGAPTLRDPDGLAMSSRNQYLSAAQRADALSLSQALFYARDMVTQGTLNTDRLKAEIVHRLTGKRRVRLIYVETVEVDSLEPLREVILGRTLVAVAAWVDEIRLIDNVVV